MLPGNQPEYLPPRGNILSSDFTIFPMRSPTCARYTVGPACRGWRATRVLSYPFSSSFTFRARSRKTTTIRPSARRNSLSSNRSSYSEPAIATQRFITAALIIVVANGNFVCSSSTSLFPPSLLFLFLFFPRRLIFFNESGFL